MVTLIIWGWHWSFGDYEVINISKNSTAGIEDALVECNISVIDEIYIHEESTSDIKNALVESSTSSTSLTLGFCFLLGEQRLGMRWL